VRQDASSMRTLAPFLALLLALSAPTPAHANALCRWTGLCLYLSPGFTLTVVDAETGKPLPDVYAWAEWVQYGAHGIGGPLMVQDATSDTTGRLDFRRWGPILGSRAGLVRGTDPAVILFKPGYVTLLLENAVPLGASEHATFRGMSRDSETIRLQLFRGSSVEWVEQINRLVYPGFSSGVSAAAVEEFRSPYLHRIEIVTAELSRLPADLPEAARLQSALGRSAQLFRGGKR
jgi:hypothetical protein